ncbi:MAG: alanine--glyoxylate aminotransferase family protein [Candidatus Caenarcaniphilales bacterium]|nr:alanine--glyoxylate aminotransferase family protein [Candidatus Caenarcaniphilales bacterium]
MFEQKRFLMIPGPTPVPESALLTLAKHPLPHRSPEFSEIFMACNAGLKKIAQTEEATPFIYAASGTGGMEAVLANLLNPGEKVLSVVNGVFSKRWADMASGFGAEVKRIEVESGKAVQPEEIEKILNDDLNKEIKLVLVTFSETSTGVGNPLKEITSIVRKHGALIAVDAITGLGAMPLKMDEWGVDVIVSGSQKGFMIPPGLSFVWAGPRALEKHKQSKFPRFYWDWSKSIKALENQTTAFTPNVSFIAALHNTLNLMLNEGVENIWQRHERLKQCTRKSIEAMGLKLFASDEDASAAITSIIPPNNVSVSDLRKKLKNDWEIVVADGQVDLKGKIFRIGHLGFVFDRDVLTALSAVSRVLEDLGHDTGTRWMKVYEETLKAHKS